MQLGSAACCSPYGNIMPSLWSLLQTLKEEVAGLKGVAFQKDKESRQLREAVQQLTEDVQVHAWTSSSCCWAGISRQLQRGYRRALSVPFNLYIKLVVC